MIARVIRLEAWGRSGYNYKNQIRHKTNSENGNNRNQNFDSHTNVGCQDVGIKNGKIDAVRTGVNGKGKESWRKATSEQLFATMVRWRLLCWRLQAEMESGLQQGLGFRVERSRV